MIRILLDELGDGHEDIILKIDALPTFTQLGDLYYMSDFLGLNPYKIDRVPQDLGVAYIQYVKGKFAQLGKAEVFIIFDISDQYIGGLLVSKVKSGLIQTNYVTTRDIHGYEIDVDILNHLIAQRSPTFVQESSWLLNIEGIQEGLDWSMERINRNGG